ncbi:leukotriene C4 synthase-like [Spea bombifrons]|uniref:leukotriene C4 synthase-like n=1 Tax=Spea bombifrons TaxID=233779 RepID=UPI002349242E|nr:leukotriene C4 synthase-like [Spea bombifrons]
MRDQIALLAFVTVLAVLEQAYFSMQVIWARRKYNVSPPSTSGHPNFERTFRAQLNCAEYFPIFLSILWIAGYFFHEGTAAACGLSYLYARYKYFHGYTASAVGRLRPMYVSASLIWILIGLSLVGLVEYFISAYFGVRIKEFLGWRLF